MKIYTENLRKFAKLISQIYVRGSRLHESIYLNFEDGYLYFSHTNYSGRMKIKTDFENSVNNFFVDIPTFLTLVNEYPDLIITEKYEFYNGNEKFKPAVFKKPENYETLSFNYKEENWTEYPLSEKIIINLIQAVGYIGGEKKREYHGVLLNNNNICSTDSSRFFRAYIEGQFDNIRLSREALTFIKEGYRITEKVSIFCSSDGTCCINIGDEDMEIICPKILNLKIPNLDNPEFQEKYNHKTFFIIEKQKLFDVLNFFEPFVKNEKNERLYFHIDNPNELTIEAKDNLTGNRILPLKECNTGSQGIWVARFLVLQAIGSIEDDFVKIQIDETAPAFNITGEKNEERHIIVVKIKKL